LGESWRSQPRLLSAIAKRGRFALSCSGVAIATGLVMTFGGVALRNQRSELEVQQQLAIAHVERESEERLARAERMATMGTFAMGVVHEVSTPLGVIIGRAEQIAGRPDQDDRDVRAAQAIVGQTVPCSFGRSVLR
jgi:two-component system, NtrC family, sensor kinase